MQGVNIARSRSLPRRLSPFVFATKGPKRLVSRNASVPHKAISCKSGKTWAGKVCGHSAHTGPCIAKISYALPLRTRPSSFCLISPEAVLLTGKEESKISLHVIASDSVATSSHSIIHETRLLRRSSSQ